MSTHGMKIITEREVIESVRDRWREQYPDDGFKFFNQETAGDVWARLLSLDLSTCSRDDVNSAIGSTWANNDCDFCERHSARLIRLGEEPGCDARWVDICPDCLAEANAALELTA